MASLAAAQNFKQAFFGFRRQNPVEPERGMLTILSAAGVVEPRPHLSLAASAASLNPGLVSPRLAQLALLRHGAWSTQAPGVVVEKNVERLLPLASVVASQPRLGLDPVAVVVVALAVTD